MPPEPKGRQRGPQIKTLLTHPAKPLIMLFNLTLIVLGLILLYFGGDLLICGSVRIARHFKMPHFAIGAVVMGFGTSSPELCVSVLAALRGSPELSLGNVVGSNVANIGLVLGISSLLAPLAIERHRLRREVPPLVIATLFLPILAWDLVLSRWEGFLMLLGMALYILRTLQLREENTVEVEEDQRFFPHAGPPVQFLLILVGLAGLMLGADWMVTGSANIARAMGISEWLIGITIVAVGTSLPEIVSSSLSAYRGHSELALGNVFGSNIFNIMMVLSVTALVHPLHITEPVRPDLVYSTLFTFLLLILIRLEYRLFRRDGAILLVGYVAYITLKSTGIF